MAKQTTKRFWIIRPRSKDDEEIGYDCAQEFVVRARNEEQARKLASEDPGDEGAEFWLDKKRSACLEILSGPPCIIMRDYKAG
jgi:hypothetical protein